MHKRRRIGAYGVGYDESGRVLLVRSSALSNHPGMWALPGGGLDHGEDPVKGVVREVFEETGLRVAVTGIREVFADLVEFPWRDVILHHDRIIFDVEVVGGTLAGEADGTTDLPKWVPRSELESLDLLGFVAHTLAVSKVENRLWPRPEVPDEAGEMHANGRDITGAKRVMRFGAYGVVTDPAGRVLLSLISDGYPGAGTWHLPGGGTDWGEQPAEGLLREIYEESEQAGVVGDVRRVGARHNPAAHGPEGTPYDWYTVRAVFDVTVPTPTVPRVTEAAGSTARSRWFARDELATIPLSDLARSELR